MGSVDMSAPLLQEVVFVPETDANSVSFYGGRGWDRSRSELDSPVSKVFSFRGLAPLTP